MKGTEKFEGRRERKKEEDKKIDPPHLENKNELMIEITWGSLETFFKHKKFKPLSKFFEQNRHQHQS